MPLKRAESWDHRELNDFLLARKDDRFAWGKTDCCLFPADGILAMTGTDIAADFRGKYSDEGGAFALVKQLTGGTTVADAAEYCAKLFGLPEWPAPLLAQRGDLIVAEDGNRLIAGLVHLNGRYVVTVGEKGLRVLPLSTVKRAWKV